MNINDQIIQDCLNKDQLGISFRDIGNKYGKSRDSIRSLYRRYKDKQIGNNKNIIEDNNKENKMSENEIFNRLKIERLKLQQEKNEIRNYLKKYTNIEKIIDEVRDAIEKLPSLPYLPFYDFCNTNKELVMMLSDIHYGEKSDISPINRYNFNIIRERLIKYFNKVKYIAQENKINKINICLLGDLITNFNIFKSQINQLDKDIINQIIQVSEVLSQLIYELSKQFNINVYYVFGNHGVVNKNDLGVKINFEKLVIEFMKLRLKDNTNINFIDPVDINCIWTVAKIFNYNYLLIHGDQLKDDNAGYRLKEIIDNFGYNIDEILMAHKHHYIENEIFSNYGGILMNGSIIGGNEYSFNKLNVATRSSQTCFIVEDGKDGGRNATYKVKLN